MVSFVSLTRVQHTQIDGKILFLGLLQVLDGSPSSGEHRQTHSSLNVFPLKRERDAGEGKSILWSRDPLVDCVLKPSYSLDFTRVQVIVSISQT